MRHHCVVDQLHPHALIPGKAQRLIIERREHAAIERPHIALHIAGEVKLKQA